MIGGANLLTTALLLAGCWQVNSAKWVTKRDNDQTPSRDRFNFFDLELLQSVAQTQPGNLLISPVSVKATLAMLLEGAGGKSADELFNALRLPENQPEAVQKVFHSYLGALMNQHSGQTLALSNRVFVSKHLTINQNYQKSLQKNYYAAVVNVDFSRPKATAHVINSWVRNVTNNLVPSLVEAASIQPDSHILLANAVYFKGKWATPFDSEGTVTRCFYTSAGVCRDANMMETLGYYGYSYVQGLDAYALELPYQGNQFSMVIVMPSNVEGITQLVRDILHVPLHTVISSLQETEVLLSIPRFDIEFSTDLLHTLQELGIRDIFSPLSNLTGLFEGTTQTAQVSNFFHKAKIIVNEEGSEAGAGTGALVIPLMGSTIPKFRADRPFLFFIRDKTTGVVLFAGRVSEPEAVKAPPTEDEVISSVFQSQRPVTARPVTTRPKGPYPKSPTTTAAPERRPTPSTEGTESVKPYLGSSSSQNSYPQMPTYTNVQNVKPTIDFKTPTFKPTYAQAVNPMPNSNQNPHSQSDTQYNPTNAQPVSQSPQQASSIVYPTESRVQMTPHQQTQPDRSEVASAIPLSIPSNQGGSYNHRSQHIPTQYSGGTYQANNGLNEYERREPVYVAPVTYSPRYDAPQQPQYSQNTNQNGYHSNTRSSHQIPPQNNFVVAVSTVPVYRVRQIPYNYQDPQYLMNQRNFQASERSGQRYEPAMDAQARSTSGQRNNFEQSQGGYQQGIVFPQRRE